MTLEELRAEIDSIDEELVALLNERARKALAIGGEKKLRGLPVRDEVRMDEVMAKVRSLNRGPLLDPAVEDIYRKVIEACLRIQEGR